MDTLAAYLSNPHLIAKGIERDRHAQHDRAWRETFAHPAHKQMLANHEISRTQYRIHLAANVNHLDGLPRRAEERADAERVAAYKKHQAEKRAS